MGKGKVDLEKAAKGVFGKYKKRMKRMCACGTIWVLLGIVAVIIGITFLVYFTKYWGDDDNWKRSVTRCVDADLKRKQQCPIYVTQGPTLPMFSSSPDTENV